MNWSKYFPNINMENKKVEIVDIGCGYGGFLGNFFFKL